MNITSTYALKQFLADSYLEEKNVEEGNNLEEVSIEEAIDRYTNIVEYWNDLESNTFRSYRDVDEAIDIMSAILYNVPELADITANVQDVSEESNIYMCSYKLLWLKRLGVVENTPITLRDVLKFTYEDSNTYRMTVLHGFLFVVSKYVDLRSNLHLVNITKEERETYLTEVSKTPYSFPKIDYETTETTNENIEDVDYEDLF